MQSLRNLAHIGRRTKLGAIASAELHIFTAFFCCASSIAVMEKPATLVSYCGKETMEKNIRNIVNVGRIGD